MSKTKEEIEDIVSRGTTDHGKVDCFYFDENFALVKWPGGSYWSGGWRAYCSPWVERYEKSAMTTDSLKRRGGWGPKSVQVWNCEKGKDGPLTAKRKRELIEREKNRDEAGSRSGTVEASA